jgi:dihydrolipoamide dehydrogenase
MVTLVPKHLIIATGSRPRQLPGLEPDGEFILTSDDMLRLASLPDSLLIVGGGAIGVEWASMMNDFGVKVTLIEQSSRLLPAEDDEIADALRTRLEARGIRVLTGAHVRTDTFGLDNGQLFIHVDQGEQTERLSAEKMLIAVGRQANIEDIGLENTDIRLEHGVIRVNSAQQTSEPHIYAVGDVTGGVQLAHAAMAEGILAAEHLAGRRVEPLSPHLVPRCVYSRPETASVGWTEREAREKGYDVKVGKFPFRFLGKAVVYGETDGFVKVVADRKTDDILGVHMIGAHVTDYVSEAALAQVLDATPWEVGRTIHPHPSMAESLSEAMLAVDRLSIHI